MLDPDLTNVLKRRIVASLIDVGIAAFVTLGVWRSQLIAFPISSRDMITDLPIWSAEQQARRDAIAESLNTSFTWGNTEYAIDQTGIVLTALCGIVMFLLLGLRSDTVVADNAAEVVTQPWFIFFIVGAIAICAMILPGISGSFLLVMMGMYTEVLGAVNERDFIPLLAFAIGAVVGLALFSTLLNYLLTRYRNWVIAAMIGLMLGSMRVLWPWPNGTNTTTLSAPAEDVWVPILLAVIGVVVVIAVDMISRRYVEVEPIGSTHQPVTA